MAELTYQVRAESETDARVRVNARGMDFIIDEPENAGGTNLGPNPVEYLLGALAGCISITGRLAARQMGIAVNRLSVELEGDLNTAGFMGRAGAGRPGYSEIRVKLHADLAADEAQKQQWLEAVESRCPVGDNLRNLTPIRFNMD